MGLLIYCNCFCQCFVSLKVELKIDDVTDAYIDSSWTWQFKLNPVKQLHVGLFGDIDYLNTESSSRVCTIPVD